MYSEKTTKKHIYLRESIFFVYTYFVFVFVNISFDVIFFVFENSAELLWVLSALEWTRGSFYWSIDRAGASWRWERTEQKIG